MTTLQQTLDTWSNVLNKPLPVADDESSIDSKGVDFATKYLINLNNDQFAAPGSASTDQDLIASAAESNKFETIMPDTSWAGLNLREVARGSQQNMSQAAAVIATPSLRAEFIQSLMKPAAKIADWLNPPKTEYDVAISNLTKRNLAQQLSMAVEPAGSGLTASPQDLQSEIIALRGTQQGLSQGQQEGFMGDVSRGIGQSAPSMAVTAGTLVTGGSLLPMMLASQVYTPMASYTNSQLSYMDELEQRRYDQALAGETLSEFDPVEMGRRAEIGAIIETTAEAGGAAFGAKFIGKVAGRVGTSSAARFATNKFAKTGAVKAATEVVRRSGSAVGRAFTAANQGVMNFTPGFIYRGAQVAGISGFEEAGEELFAGMANAPFTYAPLGQDVNDALYSMAVASVSGGASGAASSGGLAVREAVVNVNDAFRPENDRERIVRQTHSDAMKARSNWSEGLEQTQRDRIAAKLDTIEGMTPDERGEYVMALADRKAEIIANAETTLAERQEVDVAMTGAQEVLDKAKAAAGTASPTADQDIYEAEFALLVLQDKAKQLDQQLVLANTDHMIATAEHGAVAEKISDMPATVVRSTPVEVLASVGTRSGVALNETKAPRWGKKIANEMEALGTQVVWYTPADKKSSNPGFHSRRTPGVIYLNAASNQQRVRAVALEEAFHDIQMFRPDIAKAFVDKAGLFPVYEAALEYVSRGGAETAAIERQDEAAFAQAENVAATLEGETSDISPNTARAGAARISQEGEANAFARAMAGIKAKGAMSSLTRLAARSGLMGRESLAAMAVVDRVARSAAVEAVSGKTGDATLSPLARTLMWASDMDVDFARDIPTADRELSEPISPPAAPVAAKPKMDRVAHKREKESGRYVGAPDWVGNSPAQLAKLRFKLRKLAKEGEAGRYWYEDSSRAILEMTGGDKVEAEKIVSLIAIYSPNATVSANTTMALTAYYQFKAGLDINAGFSKADEKATALLKNGQAWSGIKTNSFYQNLMVEIDPSKLDTNVSTMDMWMAIAFDYGDKVLDQGSKYRFAERETARLAQELGWTAHQVQAAIWSAMKGRIDPIRGQLKAEELRLGIGEMVTKVDPDTGKESLVYEVKKDKKKEHFRLAHKMGMEYDLQDKDINAAKFDFSTALRDRMVQQSYETTPSTTSGAPIPGIHTATLDKVFEYQRALAPVLFPNGKDIVAEMVGLPQGDTIEGVSAWESKVQTGIQSFVAAPTDKSGKAKRLKPSAIKLLDLAARIRGYALTQDAVAYHTAVFDDAKIRHNGIELRTNRALNHQEIELFYRALHEKFNRWDLNPIYRKDGLRVLNFTQFDKSQKPVSNKEFKNAWQAIVQSLPDTFGGGIVGSASFRSEGNNVSNDWSKDKNGEGYLDRITAERPDILGQVRNLRLAVQAVNDQFVAKYGWDKAGVSFARSDERRTVGNGVEQPAAGTLTPLAGSPVIQGFTGPDPSIVDVAKRYAASRGIDFKRQAEYADVDPERAARIADAYQTMVHDPQNPAVADAYEQLIEQTTAQYQMLVDAGYQFYFFDPENDPYADQPGGFGNPYNAVRDLRANKRMAVFPSESGFGSGATDIDVSNNLLLADTGLQWAFGTPDGTLKRVTANDLFRAVHDAMGHSIEGAGFRARGEENAWQAHVRLFTGSAIGAMTSETRGQNSWLNFGPFGEKNKAAKVEDTTFADQKVGLMPSFTWEDGRVPDESFAREPRPLSSFTPQWRGWFGDSKVVDADGNPLIMYHGSPNATYDQFGFLDNPVFGLFGPGFYFTADPQIASTYALQPGSGKTGAGVYPVYLSIKNPMDMDAPFDTSLWSSVVSNYRASKQLKEQLAGYELDLIAQIERQVASARDAFMGVPIQTSGMITKRGFIPSNEFYVEQFDTNEAAFRHLKDSLVNNIKDGDEIVAVVFQDMFRQSPIDGFTHLGGGRVQTDSVRHRVWIAFEPNQIKSSFNENPTDAPELSFAREDERDVDYMAAVDRGDITAAQRMVDEKAKAAGYNVDVFRGDASAFKKFSKLRQGENFDEYDGVFPRGFFWFTTSDKNANWYANIAARNGGIPTVRRFYLNPGNIFVYPIEDSANEGEYGVPGEESELQELGNYDSMLIHPDASWQFVRDESGKLQTTLDKGKHKHYAVTNPTQIKSADPITYDESGNVVPLSRRFDDTNVDISFSRGDERDVAFQKMQAERRAAQAEVMKDLSPREQALIIEAGVADYDEILDLKDKIDKLKKQIAGGTPAAVEKSKRTADLQTAAQRVNALSEVRKLERKLNAMTMLADQRLGQVNRAKARLQTQTQLAIEEQQSAAETIASLEEQITATRDAVVAAKRSIAEERTATKEQRDALNTALANAEATAQRAINWAYAIGRNEGLVAGQVAGQQAVQTDLERGQQAEEKLKELQKSERFQKFASQRAIDWAYRIGRNEGLVAGQVAGQQTLKPEMTRLARVESLLDISVRRVRELKATVRNDARAAQRAVNFAYSMGLNKGRMQGIMQGRAQILARMRKREDTLQNQLFNLRELMNTRLDDVAERNRIIRKIVSEALLSIPANLRGTLANRAATATTVAQANRVAIEAVRIAINAEATAGLKVIARTAKRLNKRGMKVAARKQIVTLLYEANVVLRDANNRKRQAKVVTAKGSPVTLSGAIDLYSRVLDAQTKVENAVALYDTDRAEFIAERDQRIVRYADLTQRLMANMAGRRVIAARARADQAARLSVLSKISRANSDIYTLSLELEGKEDGVIDELLRLAQEGKGEAALEHARIMRDLEPALIAAGYEGVDDYRLKNGGYGDGSTELVTVSLGGKDVTIPLGIAMSIAAMDEETLALFDGTNAGKQGIQFNETSSILTLYPSGDDIRNIRANLTVGQRDLIERMKDILETQIRDRAMQAIWEVTGDQPPIVTRYYPRIRNMEGIGGEKVDLSAAAGAAVRGALTAVGFANARVGGSQPLIYTDMVQTMDRHMQVALDMIHMAQPYRDAMTVLNDPKVVKGIDDQLGSGTASGVRSIFSNGVGATSRTKPSIIDKLTSNVTGAKLAMNPSTIAKVLIGGTIRLSSEIPLSLWTRGTARAARYARTPGTWSGRIDQIHLVNGYFSRRHQMQMKSIFSGALGDSDRAQLGNALTAVRDNLRATGNNLAAGKITDAINAVGDANRAGVMGLSAVVDMLRYADEQIMLAAVEARLAEVEDEGLLTGTDALTEASNRAERDFRKTQNASDEFDDSYFAATSRTDGNAGWRLLFPFSSDPLKARNQIRRAVLSGNRTRTAFAVGGNIVSGTTISSLSTIVTAKVISLFASMIGAGDDEEEKKAVNKAWWENTLVSVPTQLAGDVMSVTMGYMGIMFANALSSIVYRRFLISPLIGSPAQDVVNEAKDALKKDSTTTDMMFAIVGGSLATLQYGGIPFYPLYRLVMRSLELQPDAPKTLREKIQDRIKRKKESFEKMRSN